MTQILSPRVIIASLVAGALWVFSLSFTILNFFREMKPSHRQHLMEKSGIGAIFPAFAASVHTTAVAGSFPPALAHPTYDLLLVSILICSVVAVVVTIYVRASLERELDKKTAKDIPSRPTPKMQQHQQHISFPAVSNASSATPAAPAATVAATAPPVVAAAAAADGGGGGGGGGVPSHPSVVVLQEDDISSLRPVQMALKCFNRLPAPGDASNPSYVDFYNAETLHQMIQSQLGWEFKSTKYDGIRYYARPAPFVGENNAVLPIATLFTAWIPAVRSLDVQLVMDHLPDHSKFDTLLKERRLLKRFDDSREVWQNDLKSPVFLVAPRNVVTERVGAFLNRKQIESLGLGVTAEKAWMLAADDASQQYPPTPEEKSAGFVRANMITALVLALEWDGGVFMISTASVDPAGNLPSAVVSATLSAGFDRVRLQRELIISENKTGARHKMQLAGRFSS